MDEYADVYYNLTGNKKVGFGNVTERQLLRKDMQCKSFKWYLDTVAPYMFAPIPQNYHHHGLLRNVAAQMCIHHDAQNGKAGEE